MDIEFLLMIQNFREATNGILDGFFGALTAFGVSVWAFLMMAMVYWCFDKRAGAIMCINVGVGNMVNQLAKNIFCVYRPWVRDPRVIPATSASGYSFPSGHSQLATAEWGSIAVWQKKRKWVVAICCVLIALIAFSRNYFGVHTPQDVLVGITLCSLVMIACYRIMAWVDGGKNRDLIVFGIGMALCTAFLLFNTFKSYPMDYAENGELIVVPTKMIAEAFSAGGCAVGALVGWIIERKLIRFEPMKKWWQKLLCLLIGGVILYFVMNHFCPMVSEALKATGTVGYYFGKLLYYVILYVYILAVVPAFIKLVSVMTSRKK